MPHPVRREIIIPRLTRGVSWRIIKMLKKLKKLFVFFATLDEEDIDSFNSYPSKPKHMPAHKEAGVTFLESLEYL
jgi:hypothetical protein